MRRVCELDRSLLGGVVVRRGRGLVRLVEYGNRDVVNLIVGGFGGLRDL